MEEKSLKRAVKKKKGKTTESKTQEDDVPEPKGSKENGTKEWATTNVNCIIGCEHNCRYCYAKHMAVSRFKRVDEGNWSNPVIRYPAVNKTYKKRSGVIMFPSSHDITPSTQAVCMVVLGKLLAASNKVLVVSKPHIVCIKDICKTYEQYKDRMAFRFTIGAMDNDILSYWEPGAPSFEERFKCLKYAYNHGFKTSVSMEPCLDVGNAPALVHVLKDFVTDSIWIGPLNNLKALVVQETKEDKKHIRTIQAAQTKEHYLKLAKEVEGCQKIRWKKDARSLMGMVDDDQMVDIHW
jgi:DNA repair photolyase